MLAQVFNESGHGFVVGYTPHVDFWSLGVLMYKLLFGSMLFSDEQIASLVAYMCWSDTIRAEMAPDYLGDYSMFLELRIGSQSGASSDMQAFLTQLFTIEWRNRIGSGQHGVDEIKKHPCFKSIDWHRLYHKRVLPPYMPSSVLPSSCDLMEPVHDSFLDMIMACGDKSCNLSMPYDGLQQHFHSWYFVSNDVLRDEVRIEDKKRDLHELVVETSADGGVRSSSSLIGSLPAQSWTLSRSSKISSDSITDDEDLISIIERKCLLA
jgi:serine/threonine protein kinase